MFINLVSSASYFFTTLHIQMFIIVCLWLQAKEVAAATQSLCDAANSLVQGHSSEERLISSAKLVASNTAKLLVACRVKADADSGAMRRLQGAGNAVKRATDALVKAALLAKGGGSSYESITVQVNQRMVGGIAQVCTRVQDYSSMYIHKYKMYPLI